MNDLKRKFSYGPACKVPHSVIHANGNLEEIVCGLAGEYTRTEQDENGLTRDVFTCGNGHVMAMYHELHPADSRHSPKTPEPLPPPVFTPTKEAT